jgi:hypothetical protein
MKVAFRLIATALAAFAAQVVHAQADDAVKLRLALDGDGRLYLTTEPASYTPPPLLQVAQPTLAGWDEGLARIPASLAIDLRAAPDSAVPCLAVQGLSSLSRLQTCDPIAYTGLPGAIEGGSLTLNLDTGRSWGFDLSYGLHWLDLADGAWSPGSRWHFSGPVPQSGSSIVLPGWIGSVLGDAAMQTEHAGLGGFFWIGPDLKLNFNYERANGALALIQPEIGTLLPWETGSQDSFSIGLNYGRLQGMLIGRQVRPDHALGNGLAGRDALDLGFTWRMPWWNAALEFGARNLLVRPREPSPDASKTEQGDLRVPYLRYHQEL